MKGRLRLMARFCALMLSLGLSSSGWADVYPDRPIKIVGGFAPGGNVDTIARILAPELGKRLGQQVIVEARPGAGGAIAAAGVANAAPDGYTLLLASGGHAVSGALSKSQPFDTVEGFEWISTATVFPFVLAARARGDVSSVQTLLALARHNPGSVTFGTPGVGSTPHLIGELLAAQAGVKLLHVPYKGEAAALTGLLGGEIQMVVAAATAPLPHIEAGRLIALAVTGASRWDRLPSVPTVQEAGVAGFDVGSWGGLAAPRSTPKAIIDRLNVEMQGVLAVPEVQQRLKDIGGVPQGSSPELFRKRVQDETARWSKLIQATGITQ
jgi:tripartite-type tricarboxylate transporter receptor subunit TctC